MQITNKCGRLPENAQVIQVLITKHETHNKYTVLYAENNITAEMLVTK